MPNFIHSSQMVGTLFKKEGAKSAVICIGGASGRVYESQAKNLADAGFTSLALSYFGVRPLPERLEEVPLEYFESAIDQMLSESGVEKVGLWGVSRGAEAALIIASLFPEKVHAVAAHVPSSVVFGTLDGRDKDAWIYQNRPFQKRAFFKYTKSQDGSSKETAIASTSCFFEGEKQGFASSQIPVENLKCPLLLISARDDQMWPSEFFANQIVKRLEEFESPIPRFHFCYENAGHSPSKGEIGFHPILKRWFLFGGTEEGNRQAAYEWEEKTIAFFKLCL